MPRECEVCIDPILEGREAPLVEAGRWSTPEGERALELARRRLRVARGEALAALADVLLEAVEVELAVLHPERIARRQRDGPPLIERVDRHKNPEFHGGSNDLTPIYRHLGAPLPGCAIYWAIRRKERP